MIILLTNLNPILGSVVNRIELLSCSHPDVHASFHEPDRSSLIATKMKLEMIENVKLDPTAKVSTKRDRVILKYKEKYDNETDPVLWQDIISSLGRFSSLDATLGNYKKRALGNVPRKRRDFNPSALLSQVENGKC